MTATRKSSSTLVNAGVAVADAAIAAHRAKERAKTRNLAAVPSATAPRITKQVDEASARLDETIPTALALADALKVLTALERAPSYNDPEPYGMTTGEGYASGHTLVDATMPELALQLRKLLEQIDVDRKTVVDGLDAEAREAALRG